MAEHATDEAVPPPMPRRTLYAFVGRLAFRHPWLLLAAVVASVGIAVANVLSIALVLPFLDALGGAAAIPDSLPLASVTGWLEPYDVASTIRIVALLLIAMQLVRSALSFAESRVSAYLKILIERDLRERIFDDLLRVEYRYVRNERTANLQTLLQTYPRQAADIADQYLSAFKKGLTGATYFLALIAVSLPLTLIALALGGLSLLAVEGINRAVRRNAAETNELRVRLQQTTLESIVGMKLIRLHAREDDVRERYGRELREMRQRSFRGGSLSALIPPVQGLVATALAAALIIAGSYVLPAQAGDGWVAVLAVFLIVTARLAQPLQSFSKRRAKITSELPALEEVYRFLHAEKPYLAEGTRRFERLEREVRFDDVTYAYDGSVAALSRVDLRLEKGRTTALVGASGSGKSTVLALLGRLADPTSGRVLVDGVDLRELDSRSWRRALAFVSQDAFLFHDTVANNIRFARPEATRAEVEAAARLARAHDFIVAMEKGYDTLLGDRGARLSGGQAQRIAIARAILADPQILVLDEATSALDAETEREVQEALEDASRGRTVVVVAHRLSTIRSADVIHVLDGGRVVESGTYDALLAKGGAFARLARAQESGAPLEPPAAAHVPAAAPAVEAAPQAPPLRAILTSPVRTATIQNGRELAEGVPVRVVGVHGDRDSLLRQPGDALVVALGETLGTLRLHGAMHEVALWTRRPDGREVRVVARRKSS